MLHWEAMCRGTVASFPIQTWIPAQVISRRPEMMNKTIIRASFQGYCEPPHWRARRQETTQGMKIRVPRGSSPRRRRRHVRDLLSFWFCLGGLKERTRVRAAKAPMGRLMKNHQRHETLSVRAPPISGPTTKVMPHAAPTRPVSVKMLASDIVSRQEGRLTYRPFL
jgi:hypothetical protein